jgi:hypothetical protein
MPSIGTIMLSPFTKHPHSVGETYFEHARFAFTAGIKMVCAGLACMIHGVFPFLFIQTGSKTIINLHEKLTQRKNKETNQ